jgi:hypothetical protein
VVGVERGGAKWGGAEGGRERRLGEMAMARGQKRLCE